MVLSLHLVASLWWTEIIWIHLDIKKWERVTFSIGGNFLALSVSSKRRENSSSFNDRWMDGAPLTFPGLLSFKVRVFNLAKSWLSLHKWFLRGVWPWGTHVGPFAVHEANFWELKFHFFNKSYPTFPFPCMQLTPRVNITRSVWPWGTHVRPCAVHVSYFWKINFHFINKSYAAFPFSCMQSKRHHTFDLFMHLRRDSFWRGT